MSLTAICDNCHRPFKAHNLISGNISNLTMINVGYGPCPYCGGMGSIPNGIYNLRDGVATLIQAVSGNPEARPIISQVINDIRNSKIGTHEAIARISNVAPQSENILNGLSIDTIIAVLSLLVSLLAWLNPTPGQTNEIDTEEFYSAQQEIIKLIEEDSCTRPSKGNRQVSHVKSRVSKNIPHPDGNRKLRREMARRDKNIR